MSLNALYENELSYMRELGQDFARANPRLAGFLSREASDPDVERLLEGFAFSVAQLRQKLEDEMPELVHGLMRLLWPHYLRPIPPLSVVALSPASEAEAGAIQVPAGIAVASRPVAGVSCRFRTCYPVTVLPFTVTDLQAESSETRGHLSVTLEATGRASLRALRGGTVRLFLNTEREPSTGRMLLLWLSRHLRAITATTEGGRALTLAPDVVRPVGFAADEAVIPYPPNAFAGFRTLQEYLAFPAKFLFLDIGGLAPVADMEGRRLTLRFDTTRPFPDHFRVVQGQIALNCTPVINLFRQEAHPLRIDRSRSEYRIVTGGPPEAAIYAVDGVTGSMQGRAGRITYAPFESFRHDRPGAAGDTPFYRESLRPAAVGGGIDHFLTFVTPYERPAGAMGEVVSVALSCTNGALAERLAVGMIDQPTSETPATIRCTNIMGVSPHTPPPIGEGLLWRLLSNLARNFASLADVAALRTVLASYDFRAIHDIQARRRLELLQEALEDFTHGAEDAVIRGCPVRLRTLTCTVAESKIGGEAELFLFGSVLDRFFDAYAGVNSLHRFTIRGRDSNVEFRWAPRRGMGAPR